MTIFTTSPAEDIALARAAGMNHAGMLANLAEHERMARQGLARARDGLRRQDQAMYGRYWRHRLGYERAVILRVAELRRALANPED